MNKGGCCGRLCKRPQITSSAALEWNGFGMKCRAPKSSAFFATRSDTTPERKIVFGASPCCRSSSRTVSPQISGSATSIRRRSGICFCMLRRTSRPVPTVIIEIWLYFSAILHSGLSFQNHDTSPLPFGRGDDKCTQLSFLNFRFGASSPAERYRGGVAGQKYFPETRATYHIQLCLSSRTRKSPVYLHLTE